MDQNKKLKIIYKLSTLLNCNWETIAKLSLEQIVYINQTITISSFLEACPGSGKTEVIGLKTAYNIKKWDSPNGGLAIVTFTTSAAKELNNRIRKFSTLNSGVYPHFIGTFDSWLHNYMFQPFCHYLTKYSGKDGDKSIRIIEDDNDAAFLLNYQSILTRNGKRITVNATEYHFSADLKSIIGDTEKVKSVLTAGISDDELKDLRKNKKEFLIKGFATYTDAENLSITLLEKFPFLKQKLSQRFPVIVIDECQDLSQDQIHILEVLRASGSVLHFVGDMNQSIYEFREVKPEVILNYLTIQQLLKFQLTKNYRSCQSIVNVSQALLGNQMGIIAHNKSITQFPCILWQYDAESFDRLPGKFEQLIRTHNLSIKNSVILARGKSTLKSLKTQSDKYGISKTELFAYALNSWCKNDRTTEDLQDALFYIGRAFCLLAYNGNGNPKNQFCPDNFDHIEWRLLLKDMLNRLVSLYPFENSAGALTWSDWVINLKGSLSVAWSLLTGKLKEYDDIKNKLRSPDKRGNNLVNEIKHSLSCHNPFRTTTIHSVKGESLDAVLLLSHPNKQSRGGHYTHWFREASFDAEHIRYAYVGCSRAKNLLILATPKLSNSDLIKLQNLGFTLQY